MDLINALDAWKTGKIDPDTGEPVSLLRVFLESFDITITGANVSVIATEISINDSTWTELRGTGFLTRNTLAVQAKAGGIDATSPFMINGDNTEVGYKGIEVLEGDERIYDISQVSIYAKSKSGTFTISVEELS